MGVGIIPRALAEYVMIELEAELIEGTKNQICATGYDARAV